MPKNRWLTDNEIDRSKSLTRNNPQRTRCHHYVPQMYLRRWAGDDGVRFVEVATGESDIKDPEEIANDEFFYQIEAPDIDPDEIPDLWFETHMSRIEDGAARWLRALDGAPDGRLKNTNLCENLAVFVALQSQRTPRARAASSTLRPG